jgi:hypothetical protein
MQSNRSRLVLVLVAVAVAVVAVLVLRPFDGESEQRAAAPAGDATDQQGSGERAGNGSEDQTGPAQPAEPEPPVHRIDVQGGQAVGGVERIEVRKGDPVRLEVRSDAAEEVHVHGYNEIAEVGPGEPARLSFPAELEGIFEIELEGAHTQIAELEVRP